MRYFIVTVHPMRVQVDEIWKDLKTYDCSAVVDGDIWRYKIKRSSGISKNNRDWRARAYHHIHYHAHNSGAVVHFEPVHHQKRGRPKISKKLKSFPI